MRTAFNLRALTVAELTERVVGIRELDPRLLRALARDPRQGVRRLAARLRASQARAAGEAARLEGLFAVEREQQAQGFAVIAGVDEVGVAALAGPDDGCARPGVSAVWIWPAQRLWNETAPGGHPALRRHTHAPAVVFLSAGVPGIACAHDPVTRTRTSPPIGVNRMVYPPKGR